MKIYVTPDIPDRGYLSLHARALSDDDFILTNHPPLDSDGWLLTWGTPIRKERNAAIETGFFFEAIHIDPRGLYTRSSLNVPEAIEMIRNFDPPEHAEHIIFTSDLPHSKYRQPERKCRWYGVVLPLQVSGDRSVISAGGKAAYLDFVRGACKRYGKHLLLKIHPAQHGSDIGLVKDVAHEHGCFLTRTDMSVLNSCKFVLVFCSSFAVDCFLRGVPVAQFAPGYWHKTGAVTYTDGEFPDDVEDTTDMAFKLVDWLIWRYCFNWNQPVEQWVKLLRHFARSEELFPLPIEWSYAANRQHHHSTFQSAYQ